MRAAAMKERPSFPLMRQADVQSIYHMQMPLWLFSDPRYADMSLEAKLTYTFLLNRFQLSRRYGWENDFGGFSNRLCRQGCAGPGRPDHKPCGTSPPIPHFLL